MENRRKFYTGGLWANDLKEKRFEHICGALAMHFGGILNDEDLKFVIKNAFVSKILVSEEVIKLYPLNKNTESVFGETLYKLYESLITTDKVLSYGKSYDGYAFFDICKIGDRISSENSTRRKAKLSTHPSIIIEHIVPGEVYLEDVKDKYKKGLFDFSCFETIFNSVGICLVSKDQDKKLNSYKSKMPANIDYKTSPFARYDKVDIDVYGWNIVNGCLKEIM